MQRLPLLIILALWVTNLLGQNPHGEELKIDCKACHTSEGWSFASETSSFDHNTTEFPLEGQHQNTDCKLCHTSLVFNEAETTCNSCHTDVHNMSVGNDCVRCHNSQNWLVDIIPELHEQNGFPLMGQHRVASCTDCHISDNNLVWSRIGNDCGSCHLTDYNTTSNPNHMASGFSTNCADCHLPTAESWGAENFHLFFPLEAGHNIADCAACHDVSNYSAASPECNSCHMTDYNNAANPNHLTAGFGTNCNECHTINGWQPADYAKHDANSFPIYSGNHRDEWSSCTECHIGGDYNTFSCIDCHEHNNQANLANEHDDVGGFRFESNACYACHPRGEED